MPQRGGGDWRGTAGARAPTARPGNLPPGRVPGTRCPSAGNGRTASAGDDSGQRQPSLAIYGRESTGHPRQSKRQARGSRAPEEVVPRPGARHPLDVTLGDRGHRLRPDNGAAIRRQPRRDPHWQARALGSTSGLRSPHDGQMRAQDDAPRCDTRPTTTGSRRIIMNRRLACPPICRPAAAAARGMYDLLEGTRLPMAELRATFPSPGDHP